jgi:PAS domain S-box-containing protein
VTNEMKKNEVFPDHYESDSLVNCFVRTKLWIQFLDISGNPVFINDFTITQSGYDRDAFSVTDFFWDTLFANKNEGIILKNTCCQMMAAGEEFSGKTIPIITRSQKLRFVSWNFLPVRGKDANISGGLLYGVELPKYEKRFQSREFERYFTIFDQAPVGFFISLSEGRFLEVNHTFAVKLGYAGPKELLQSVKDIGADIYANPDERKVILDTVFKSPGINTFELELKRKTGETFFVRMYIQSRFDAQLSKTVLEGTIEDITELKIEHDALVSSRNHLSSLLKAMDESVAIIDRQGNLAEVVPNAASLFSFQTSSSAGNISTYFDESGIHHIKTKISSCLSNRETTHLQLAIERDGVPQWHDVNMTPLNDDQVLWVSRDVTVKVNAQHINEVMLNISRAVSFSGNLNDLFEIIRKELSRVIDVRNFYIALYDATNHTLSLPYFRDEKDHFDSFPAEKTISSLVLKRKQAAIFRSDDISRLEAEGLIEIVGTPARVWVGVPLMVEGEVLGIMAVQNYEREDAFTSQHLNFLETISSQVSLSIRRKQDEEALKRSERRLRESNMTKDKLFSIIAHDLKNPFNTIMGFANLLKDDWEDFSDKEKYGMVKSIRESSENAYGLLINLLEWSRLQVGGINFNPEYVNIEKLISINFDLIRPAALKKDITLRKSVPGNRSVWADFHMLNAIIRNLLSNAVKFTGSKGQITVTCKKQPDHPDKIVIEVSDTGVGIAQSRIDNLFRISPLKTTSGTAGETGSGLGLVICKEFVERNKGEIRVESAPEKGTTFFITLHEQPVMIMN